jgi:hypothetical protein
VADTLAPALASLEAYAAKQQQQQQQQHGAAAAGGPFLVGGTFPHSHTHARTRC